MLLFNMRKEIENIVFELNDVESERARAFVKKHDSCPSRSMGEKIVVSFMPSSLGDLVNICCCACGVREDITDTDKF